MQEGGKQDTITITVPTGCGMWDAGCGPRMSMDRISMDRISKGRISTETP